MLNPSLSFWVHCTDAFIFPIVGSTGALCWLGLHWAHCTGEYNLPTVGLTGDSKLSLSCSFWLGFLHGFNKCSCNDIKWFLYMAWHRLKGAWLKEWLQSKTHVWDYFLFKSLIFEGILRYEVLYMRSRSSNQIECSSRIHCWWVKLNLMWQG